MSPTTKPIPPGVRRGCRDARPTPALWNGSVCRSPVRSSLSRKLRARVHIPQAPSKNRTPDMPPLFTDGCQVADRLVRRNHGVQPQDGFPRVQRRSVNRGIGHPDGRGDGGEQRQSRQIAGAMDRCRCAFGKLGQDTAARVDHSWRSLATSVAMAPPVGSRRWRRRGAGRANPARKASSEKSYRRPGFGADTRDVRVLRGSAGIVSRRPRRWPRRPAPRAVSSAVAIPPAKSTGRPVGDLECPRQELRRASVAGEMPARFASLGDEPVGAPAIARRAWLLAADHDEHEHPATR